VTDVIALPRVASEAAAPASVEEPTPEERPRTVVSRREVAVVVAWGLTIFGILIIGYVVYLVGVTRLEHARAQRTLTEAFDNALANQAAPIGGRIDEGTPIAVMHIPRFGVTETVVEGSSGAQLRKGPGHLRSSVLPGQAGNAVVACRRVTFGAPCYNVTELRPGDSIEFVTGQGEVTYRVVEVRGVREGDADVLENTSRNQLTLVTSQRVWADRRVAVIARLVGGANTTPPGRPTELRSSELGLNTEGSKVLALVLWMQALLIASLIGVWLLRSKHRVSVYLVMTPVLLLLTLLVFDSVTALLPSTL
jgi:sortase A